MSSALRGPVQSAVTSCCFSRRQLKMSNAAIVLGVPYKGCLNSPTPTGEVIMKSADLVRLLMLLAKGCSFFPAKR
jgi:hypothetical protein